MSNIHISIMKWDSRFLSKHASRNQNEPNKSKIQGVPSSTLWLRTRPRLGEKGSSCSLPWLWLGSGFYGSTTGCFMLNKVLCANILSKIGLLSVLSCLVPSDLGDLNDHRADIDAACFLSCWVEFPGYTALPSFCSGEYAQTLRV